MQQDPIPKDLFDILACPDCKGNLKYSLGKTGLICTKCKTRFPIQDGIPVLLPKAMQK